MSVLLTLLVLRCQCWKAFLWISRLRIQLVLLEALALENRQVFFCSDSHALVVQLLERFYEYEQGSICIDNIPLEDFDVHWLRRQIGLVSQEPTLFEGSFAENVGHGLVGTKWEHAEASVKRDMIVDACKMANAHEFIMKLPDGYDTPLGQRGTLISGGQKQRIAIARAIVKKPKILLLDEATSALDTNSERIVQEALDRAVKGRTTITIAHRLSTIKNCDKIVVMSKGSIKEMGTHQDLMNVSHGAYRQLVNSQHLENELDPPAVDLDTDFKPESRQESDTNLDKASDYVAAKVLNSSQVWRGIMNLGVPDMRFLVPGFFGAIIAGLVYDHLVSCNFLDTRSLRLPLGVSLESLRKLARS